MMDEEIEMEPSDTEIGEDKILYKSYKLCEIYMK